MLKLSDINAEIEKLEQHSEKPNCSVCQQLAWLYTIRDHMTNEKGTRTAYTPRSEAVDLTIYDAPKAPGMSMRTVAEKWTSGMENEDGTRGPHWTIEQINKVMAQNNISGSPWVVLAVMNSLYSDYCAVFNKYGVGDKLNFYVDMTKAWLNDKDAVCGGGEEKAKRYYEYVVHH